MVQTPLRPQVLSLELPEDISLQVSPAQFERLAVANRELRLERSATGALIVNPPTGWETGKRNSSITTQLGRWYEDGGEPGEHFESSTGFTLPNGAISSPDASWVSQERWDALRSDQKKTFPNICPDFVVELRSGSDRLKPLQEKMQEYMDNGAKLGWLIDPKNRKVEIYRQGQSVETLAEPAELSRESVVPGFTLKLRRIWT